MPCRLTRSILAASTSVRRAGRSMARPTMVTPGMPLFGTFRLCYQSKHRHCNSFMQKITPFLWFNDNAEEAVNFYTSIFKNSKIGAISRYGEAGPGKPGTVMSARFELEGQEFIALNGGPMFT